jgi:hypothetical protein
MAERNPRSIAMSGSTGAGVGSPSPVPNPQENPDFTQGGAPAGKFFSEAELPSVAVVGGPPATFNGYTPDPSRTPQSSTVDDPSGFGVGTAPSGLRR